ncbi:hypothetical protein OPQ81_004893 [Rhizoctonia solani]|nr:hypothetical protein OPQ81_004893 [Rhizoctonia solani]
MLALFRLMDTYQKILTPYIPSVDALNPKTPSVELPDDVLRLIAQSYVESVLSNAKTIRALRKRRREYWAAIAPLARSSRRLWRIVIDILRTIWATCCTLQCSSHSKCHAGLLPPVIRILTLGDDWEPGILNLTPLNKLEDLSIDYHKLLCYDRSSRQLQILPGVKALPLVSQKTRDTSFPWTWYQRDGVIEHATTLASYIEGLPHLERFHINDYLTDLNSVFRHRLEHRQYHPRGHHDRTDPVDGIRMYSVLHLAAQASNDAPPINPNIPRLAEKILWTVPCPQCKHELEEPIEVAERLVASILSARHQSLRFVSFGSFLSRERIEPSEWMVEQEYGLDRLVVWTRRPTTTRSRERYRCEFERQGIHWTLSAQ